jgi:hypothetical protein
MHGSLRMIRPPNPETTRIHKVLKAIVKLAFIPKDEEFELKRRIVELLEIWNKRMEDMDGMTESRIAMAGTRSQDEEREVRRKA